MTRSAVAHEVPTGGCRITCEVTLIARPQPRSTLGRLRTLATLKSRTIVVTVPDAGAESLRELQVTRWTQVC